MKLSSMRIIHRLCAIIALCLPLAHAAHAKDANFTIRQVNVDAVGSNATQAREKAIEQGQQYAFKQVITRVSPHADIAALMEEAPELAKEEKNATISSMVRAMDIHNESVSGNRYFASVDIHFQPEYVKEFLTRYNVSFHEKTAQTLLILPVAITSETQLPTVDLTTEWAQIWQELARQPRDNSLSFTLPSANENLSNINVAAALSPNYQPQNDATIIYLKQQYEVDHIALVAAKPNNQSSELVAVTRLIGGNESLGMPQQTSLSDRAGSMQQLAAKVAEHIRQQQASSSQANLLEGDKINVIIPISQHQDWLAMQQQFSQMHFIKKWQLAAISSRQVEAILFLNRSGNDISNAFAQAGFQLEQRDTQLFLYAKPSYGGSSLFNF